MVAYAREAAYERPGTERFYRPAAAGRTSLFASFPSTFRNPQSAIRISGLGRKFEENERGPRRIIMSVSWKSAMALLVGIALAASSFQGTILAADTSQKPTAVHARITRAQAERAALAKVPGGTVKQATLQRENGQLIWSVDIVTPLTKKVAAVQVDAHTGKVLSKLAQTPADRAEESVGGQKKN
jgi:hypothetical protein